MLATLDGSQLAAANLCVTMRLEFVNPC